VYLRILGTAAGGGYPQWNCACRMCSRARSGVVATPSRLHASIALSADQRHWYLVNATPDVHHQIESCSALHPGPGLRQSPLRGVLLTDAELDHTIGLLILREGTPLEIYATRAAIGALNRGFPLQSILSTYAPFRWIEVNHSQSFMLGGDGIQVTAFRVGIKRPRYAADSDADGDWVIGYRFEDTRSKGVLLYAPAVEQWTRELQSALTGADCALIDGTFWSDDEMQRMETGSHTAAEMGHIPISGSGGTLERLASSGARRTIYVHINNTNPILDENSPEYREIIESGLEVGRDGLEIEV
jgi:pyrroloquinoline quinone biosynthesis protein B